MSTFLSSLRQFCQAFERVFHEDAKEQRITASSDEALEEFLQEYAMLMTQMSGSSVREELVGVEVKMKVLYVWAYAMPVYRRAMRLLQ